MIRMLAGGRVPGRGASARGPCTVTVHYYSVTRCDMQMQMAQLMELSAELKLLVIIVPLPCAHHVMTW